MNAVVQKPGLNLKYLNNLNISKVDPVFLHVICKEWTYRDHSFCACLVQLVGNVFLWNIRVLRIVTWLERISCLFSHLTKHVIFKQLHLFLYPSFIPPILFAFLSTTALWIWISKPLPTHYGIIQLIFTDTQISLVYLIPSHIPG